MAWVWVRGTPASSLLGSGFWSPILIGRSCLSGNSLVSSRYDLVDRTIVPYSVESSFNCHPIAFLLSNELVIVFTSHSHLQFSGLGKPNCPGGVMLGSFIYSLRFQIIAFLATMINAGKREIEHNYLGVFLSPWEVIMPQTSIGRVRYYCNTFHG